jgi:gamma-glutamyltranspeptidase/glutathione hydrolase
LAHPNRVEGGKRPRSSMSPHDRARGRPAAAGARLAGRLDLITVVQQILLDRLDRPSRRRARATTATLAEPAFVGSPKGQAVAAQYGHRFSTTSEIGAATGIKLLADGRVLAAAGPVRHGGGSAMVKQAE